jgi:small-conductance mechanosensitive channel
MGELLSTVRDYVTPEQVLNLTRALILLAVGVLLANLLSRVTRRLTADRLPPQQAQLARRVVYYLTLALFLIAGLHQLGFQLSVLLGAAGVLSVAVGFASQTSASNLVSGLFLIFEQPFQVGDIIQVGGTTGEVLAIDLLSVKLRTFDNIFVRLPNESLIKTEVRTLSRFPIRRADVQIGVDYSSDLKLVREALLAVAEANPMCLDEPAPLIIFQGFGDSSMNFQFSVWATRENYLPLKNSIQEELKAAFDERGIEIPFPHRTLYAGSQTAPVPVRLVEAPAAAPTPADVAGPEKG